MLSQDYVQRFLFEAHGVRGELVKLHDVFQTVCQQREYPQAVKSLLGQAMAATALLSATIKYHGSLVLQTQSKGPVHLLVVQADQALHMRALAKWNDDADLSGLLLGEGHMAITILPDNVTEQYQGVVALTSDQISENLEQYFVQSEQLPTCLFLTANETDAVGMLLQKMPNAQQGEQAAELAWYYWEHIQHLAVTITPAELLSLDSATLLHRLFHEEDVRIFDPQAVTFRCKCNPTKMAEALRTMGEEEVRHILLTAQVVEVCCDFCNQAYLFDKTAVNRVFHEPD